MGIGLANLVSALVGGLAAAVIFSPSESTYGGIRFQRRHRRQYLTLAHRLLTPGVQPASMLARYGRGMASNSKSSGKRPGRGESSSWTLGMLVGIAIGVSLGVAMGNIGVGIAIGAGIGVAFAIAFSQSKKSQHPQRDGELDEDH
jgi:hypothetical protein